MTLEALISPDGYIELKNNRSINPNLIDGTRNARKEYDKGRYSRAVVIYRKLLKNHRKLPSSDHDFLSCSYSALALKADDDGKLDSALAFEIRAIELLEDSYYGFKDYRGSLSDKLDKGGKISSVDSVIKQRGERLTFAYLHIAGLCFRMGDMGIVNDFVVSDMYPRGEYALREAVVLMADVKTPSLLEIAYQVCIDAGDRLKFIDGSNLIAKRLEFYKKAWELLSKLEIDYPTYLSKEVADLAKTSIKRKITGAGFSAKFYSEILHDVA